MKKEKRFLQNLQTESHRIELKFQYIKILGFYKEVYCISKINSTTLLTSSAPALQLCLLCSAHLSRSCYDFLTVHPPTTHHNNGAMRTRTHFKTHFVSLVSGVQS